MPGGRRIGALCARRRHSVVGRRSVLSFWGGCGARRSPGRSAGRRVHRLFAVERSVGFVDCGSGCGARSVLCRRSLSGVIGMAGSGIGGWVGGRALFTGLDRERCSPASRRAGRDERMVFVATPLVSAWRRGRLLAAVGLGGGGDSGPWWGPGGVPRAMELTVLPWLPSAHTISPGTGVSGVTTPGVVVAGVWWSAGCRRRGRRRYCRRRRLLGPPLSGFGQLDGGRAGRWRVDRRRTFGVCGRGIADAREGERRSRRSVFVSSCPPVFRLAGRAVCGGIGSPSRGL